MTINRTYAALLAAMYPKEAWEPAVGKIPEPVSDGELAGIQREVLVTDEESCAVCHGWGCVEGQCQPRAGTGVRR